MMAAMSALQPVSIIQGMVMLPTVAALAAVEPEISPMRALASTEMYAGPPRRRPIREFKISISRPMILVSSIRAAMPTNKIGDRQEDVRVPLRKELQRAAGALSRPWSRQTMIQEIIMASANFRFTTRFQIRINPM